MPKDSPRHYGHIHHHATAAPLEKNLGDHSDQSQHQLNALDSEICIAVSKFMLQLSDRPQQFHHHSDFYIISIRSALYVCSVAHCYKIQRLSIH